MEIAAEVVVGLLIAAGIAALLIRTAHRNQRRRTADRAANADNQEKN